MEIICKNCGSVDNYRTEKKANNLVAHCLACGSFIKNLPYSKPALYFGKYNGKLIEEFDTPELVNYLHWLRNTEGVWAKLTPRTKEAINFRLDGKV